MQRTALSSFRLIVTLAALAALAASAFAGFSFNLGASLLIILFVAFQYNFPLNLSSSEVNLIQVVALGGGLVYGPSLACWATALGILLGYGIRILILGKPIRKTILNAGFAIGLQVIPLATVYLLGDWKKGIAFMPGGIHGAWVEALSPVLLFAVIHSTLFLLDFLLHRQLSTASFQYDIIQLALVEILPLPFVLTSALAYPQFGLGTIITLGSIPAILALFINRFTATRSGLERRLQELSLLEQISQVMRSSLDLETLLGVIHQQVTQLLGVDNFYVALYDANENRIWYPLAVKHGRRQAWSPRTLLRDRLTDRVIQSGQPIFLSPKTQEELERTGLPSSEETPYAWMGVPLISPSRTIGCLAVFSVSSEARFTQEDLNLLTILSGQVSVAIENALLFDQASRRAHQLETLNRISTLITASLDLQEVLAQVCHSVVQVSGGQHSAMFLLDPEKGQVSLAYAFSLSSQFSKVNESFSVAHNTRMRCLRTGRAVLTSTLSLSPLEADYIDSLQQEGIQSYGEFPLVTPEARIGFLAIYFDSPHSFRPEEVELLQTFASQAALAVSNARLYATTDMALSRRAYQLSILEAVGRELSAAINSERLFDLILNYALEFTNSPWGELCLYRPTERILEVKAARGYQAVRSQIPLKEGLAGKAVANHQVINSGDVKAEAGYIDLTDGQARSQLCIPLIHEGRVLGVLSLEGDRPNAYTSNDQAFVSQLATQASVAVINAELYSEIQKRLREQSILYLISTRLVENPEFEMVLQTLERSMEASFQTSAVCIYLWDDHQNAYISHFSEQTPSRAGCHLPESLSYEGLKSIHTSLLKTGPLRLVKDRGLELLGNCTDCQALVYPMVARNSQRLGLVLMHISKSQQVTEEDIQLLKAIVSQASISLQNALLFSDVTQGHDRMSAILNSVGEGILMMDSSGRILHVTQFIQTITGLGHESLLSAQLPALPENALHALGYSQIEAQELVEDLAQGQATQSPKKTIKLVEEKSEHVLDRSTSPVWGQNGRIIGWMIVLRDVTEEHQIAQARELITGTLVHDLRSPVSAILSGVDAMDEVIPIENREEIVAQSLKVARNSANRVLGLIESLLDIARMQSGTMELNMVPTDLYELAQNALGEFVTQSKEFKIQMLNQVSVDLPSVPLDASKITRVIINLVDNSIKFTPSGGCITVSAEYHSNDQIAVKVTDTGTGIPDEFREKIFERFTQVPNQRGRRRGSGLGLTFCRMAVEAHGGRIWAEARRGPEKGSIFTFTLPASTGN